MSLSSKQKTLFQAWKCEQTPSCSTDTTKQKSSKRKEINHKHVSSVKTIPCTPKESEVICIDDDDINDDDLLSATVAIEQAINADDTASGSGQRSKSYEDLPGFDNFSGNLWIYPTNYPVRDYQFSITQTALFKNTLVALPTGLGKTFIAAVVLYNFYRWYPQGKVVFMAPTKPLVAQQIKACYKIMGIPIQDQAQITGATMASNRRAELWLSKRAFFVTPQVINNDLARGVCPATSIKCVVIDEAHKALGNHAYCQVIQQLLSYTRNFRVLALSATPGSDLKAVQQVVKNLLISTIELRSEDAIDIRQYTHARSVDKLVVKLSDQILKLKERYFSVIQMFINTLVNNKAIYNKDVSYLSKYALLMARDQFRKDPPSGLSKSTIGTLEGTFAISISLYHGLELLLQHGMKSFFIFLKGIMEGGKGSMRSKAVLQANAEFRSIYSELTGYFGEKPDSVIHFTQAHGTQQSRKKPNQEPGPSSSYVYSHPKMQKLEEIVLRHFRNSTKGSEKDSSETRIMVFCQYRDIVREITELLQTHRPLVRPMQFVGHAPSTDPNDEEKSKGKNNRRFTQKDQLMVVEKFRSGDYNTLISTCVGEEGLDIGDVDLIICFDSHKSPIRLVQRMGRTGRKRNGKIVMLVTEGKEERDYNSSLASRRSIHKAIMGAGKTLQYYPHSPAMIPQGLKPKCHKMFITIPNKSSEESGITKPVKSKPKDCKNSTRDISVMLKRSVKSIFLNPEETQTWKSNYMLSFGETKKLKTLPFIRSDRCLYLEKEVMPVVESIWGLKQRDFVTAKLDFFFSKAFILIVLLYQSTQTWNVTSRRSASHLSLSEWLPWQSRLQRTKYSGHSSRSRLLAEVLQRNETLDDADDEMFDVDLPPPPDIASFFQPRQPKAFLETDEYIVGASVDDNSSKLKKKRKRILMVSSDDDDFVINESLPSLNTVLHKANTESKSDHEKSYENSFKSKSTTESKDEVKLQHLIPTGSISTAISTDLEPCRSHLPGIQKSNDISTEGKDRTKKMLKLPQISKLMIDNSLSIADSISALSPSTSEESYKSIKVSKSAYNVSLNPPANSSGIDSISFDFLNVDKPELHEKSTKPACFKLIESDEEAEEEKMNGCMSDENSDVDINGDFSFDDILKDAESDMSACSTAFSQANASPKQVITTKFKSDNKLRENTKSSCNLDVQNIRKPTVDTVNKTSVMRNNLVEKESEPGVKNASTSICPPKPLQRVLAADSFDASCDMFSPQFDLDFDLSFESSTTGQLNAVIDSTKVRQSVEQSDISSTSCFPNKKASTCADLSLLNSSKPCEMPTISPRKSPQSNAEPIKLITDHDLGQLSPASLASFGLSQTKRLENRKLFSDLSTANEFSVPFAKVKPQMVRSEKRNSSTSGIPDSTELNPNVEDKQQDSDHEVKNLKRVLEVFCHDFSDDDFQTEAVLTKKLKLSKGGRKDRPESDNYDERQVVFQKRHRKKAIQSSDENSDSDMSIPFKRNDINQIFTSPLHGLEDGKSPVLTFQRKRSKKHTRNDVPVVLNALESERFNDKLKHSTPKQFLLASDSSLCSDDSFAMRKPAKKLTYKESNKVSKKNRGNIDFLDIEAEVGADGAAVSSDEDDEDTIDEEMMKFVNDAEVLTQHCNNSENFPDEEAIYLRSVRSPFSDKRRRPETAALGGRFKLAYDVGKNMDVFSQVPEQDVSDYLEDSFCVGSDESEQVSELGEITLLQSSLDSKEKSCRRPKTRAQARHHAPMIKTKGEKNQKSSKRRIVVCDDQSDDTDAEQTSEVTKSASEDTSCLTWSCPMCTLFNPQSRSTCKACETPSTQQDHTESPTRQCELCGGNLTTKGWMCRDCIAVVKMSEENPTSGFVSREENEERNVQTVMPSTSEDDNRKPCSSHSVKTPSTLTLTRKERLELSKRRQNELRANFRMKRRSTDSSLSRSSASSTPKLTSGDVSIQQTNLTSSLNACASRLNFDESDHVNSMNASYGSHVQSLIDREKPVILVDSREINGGATRLVQELRTIHNVNAQIASLQCCSYVVSNRCAVIRKTVEDISTTSKKHKLAALIKRAHLHYNSLYILVEKDRVKKGLINRNTSAAQSSNFSSVIISLSHAGVQILHSNNQDQSAKLLYQLAIRKGKAGEQIHSEVLKYSSDPKTSALFNIYQSIPGVSYVSALYLCHHFKSIKRLIQSTLDAVVSKAYLSLDAAENLMNFLTKTFDIQMTPL